MYIEAINEFIERLKKIIQLHIVELPDSKQSNIIKKCVEETDVIIKYIHSHPSTYLLLDERGTSLSSQKFAELLSSFKDKGEAITFIIGGAYGFDKTRAQFWQTTICLSQLTFTHELARVLLLEQLYRASQIQKGTGYHHE